jgi:hypothetical protein
MLFLADAKNCTHSEVCIFASVYSNNFVEDAGELEKVDIFSNNILMEFYINKNIHMALKEVYEDSYRVVVPKDILEAYHINDNPIFIRIFFRENGNRKIFSYPLKIETIGEFVFPT